MPTVPPQGRGGGGLTSVAISDLDDGVAGEIITWDSLGVATTVPTGTLGQVLTSGGAGAEPTFQAGGGEVFTWTADHNTGAFHLNITGDTTGVAATRQIYGTIGADMNFNVPAGAEHNVRVNDVLEFVFNSTELNLNNNNILNGGTAAFTTITATDVTLIGLLGLNQGANKASGTALTVPALGNYFDVTGSVTINTMLTTALSAGTEVTLQFDGAPLINHAVTAGAFSLAGQVNFQTAALDTLTVILGDDGVWHETSRRAPATGGEVFTWTADHFTGGFNFRMTGDATATGATTREIYGSIGGDISMNIAPGAEYFFKINNVTEMLFNGTSFDITGANLLNGGTAAFTDITMTGDLIVGDITLSNAKNIILTTTTGTKIGTGATQKIGFWNAVPVVQPAHIADPTGGATVDAEARTAINSILAQMATTGQQAAS